MMLTTSFFSDGLAKGSFTSIITLSSDLDLTLNRAVCLNIDTEPTEKKFWIEFNNSTSLTCKVIIKQGSIVQPILALLDLNIDIQKQPSASTNPVTHQGFKVEVSRIKSLFVLLYLNCLLTLATAAFDWKGKLEKQVKIHATKIKRIK